MFSIFLYLAYYAVAFFYLAFGVVLLAYPRLIEKYLKPCFPLLASYRYQQIGNSLNLIMIGSALLVVGKLIADGVLLGFFLALVLSGLETYLGIAFYYREERDKMQAHIHFWLHLFLVTVITLFILNTFGEEIRVLEDQAALLFNAFALWNQ